MIHLKHITLKVSVFFFLFFSILPQQLQACSCSGFPNFCESVRSTSDYVGLVVLIDSTDWNLRTAVVLENIQSPIVPDTFSLRGGDGADCGEDMNQFEIGDTLMILLHFGSNPIDYFLGICGTSFLTYSNDTLFGNITFGHQSMELEAFKARFDECLAEEPTGTSEELEEALSIFPNPADDEVSISLLNYNIDALALYDLTGRLVNQNRNVAVKQETLNVSNLGKGIYFLKVQVGEIYVMRRIMVK